MAEYASDKLTMIKMFNGQELAVHIDGPPNGETVVLVHGHGADHKMWEPQLSRYPEEGYRVIAPDMRGHGASPKIERVEIADWAEDLRLLLDHLGVEKVHMAGVSMGGIIAAEFACRSRQRLKSLVISDSFGKLKTPKEKLLGFSVISGFHFMRFLSREKLSAFYSKAYHFPGGEKAAEYFAAAARNIDFDQLIKTRKAINRVDLEDRLAEISIPALVMVGTRPGEFFIELSRRLAGALETETVLLERALDPSNLTATEDFDQRVLSFIKKIV